MAHNLDFSKFANQDNDKKKVFALENEPQGLREAGFEKPELWFRQLRGVKVEMILVPMNRTGLYPFSLDVVNKCLQSLEDYCTPGNSVRKYESIRRAMKRMRIRPTQERVEFLARHSVFKGEDWVGEYRFRRALGSFAREDDAMGLEDQEEER